jgi:hypothetical protein
LSLGNESGQLHWPSKSNAKAQSGKDHAKKGEFTIETAW